MNFVSKISDNILNNGHIINFLTDIDLYKLTMLQFIYHKFSSVTSKYKFKNRTKGIDLSQYINEINTEIDWLCTLKFQNFELEHIKKLRFMKEDFIYFLSLFQLNRKWIQVYIDSNGELQIEAEGPWLYVMMFETYILAIIEEIYTRNNFKNLDFSEGRKKLNNKIDIILDFIKKTEKTFSFADFGTRRRFNFIWQEEVIATLCNKLPKNVFIGTSNVLFSILYNIKAIGTMAHEIFQAGQALGPRPINSQSFILKEWADEYRGDLGIALTDTLGFDKFLKDFDLYFAKLYDGGRHDSDDPFKWVDKFIDHYVKLNINPLTKSAVFSDGLDIPIAIKLAEYCYGRILYSFGIGTNLTNDVGVKALQLVMKIVLCNGLNVAKISDNPSKGMCESKEYEEYLRYEIKRDLNRN